MEGPGQSPADDYFVVESLEDYEMLNCELDKQRSHGTKMEQRSSDLERQIRDLRVENSDLRVRMGTERLTVQQLEEELRMQREEMDGMRDRLREAEDRAPGAGSPPRLRIESPRDLLASLRRGAAAAPPPPPPTSHLPPLPASGSDSEPDADPGADPKCNRGSRTPPQARAGLRLRRPHKVLYANPSRWSSK